MPPCRRLLARLLRTDATLVFIFLKDLPQPLGLLIDHTPPTVQGARTHLLCLLRTETPLLDLHLLENDKILGLHDQAPLGRKGRPALLLVL